jgi:peptidoglycan glycosyltransferase
MRKVAFRAKLTLILSVLLVAGVVGFFGVYWMNSADWVVFSNSPHVYSGGNLAVGTIVDRNGTLLLDNSDGRTYADDAWVRAATLHILGDRYGYIPSYMLNEYAEDLVGFTRVSGVYSAAEGGGSTLSLTISAEVEKVALQQLGTRKGVVGVYNYQTGEILCAVSSGTYDPDNVPDIEEDATGYYDGVYVNRFTSATYVPGSIFKAVTAMAALETIPDIQEQTFYCTGSYDVDGDTIVCDGVHGTITFGQALTRSCNVAFGQIAQQVGKETLTEYAQRAGINTAISFDGVTCAAGNFDLSGAAESDVAWSGIGQYTDLINPCAYMVFMGMIANGGTAAEPFMVSEAANSVGLDTYRANTTETERAMSTDTASTLASMMHDNVVNNYGESNFPAGVYVGAKSGTAEVGNGEAPHATFAGFVQSDEYPLAFIVIVENGGYGSSVCTSIAGTVLQACMDAMDG